MKTWVTYMAALLMGFATCLLFGEYTLATDFFSAVSSYLINFSVYLFIPVLLITFASGIASLKKDEAGGRMFSSMIGWSISTTVILSVVAAVFYYFFPVKFPVTASAGSSLAGIEDAANMIATEAFGYLFPTNPLDLLSNVSTFLPPAIAIALVLGLALKPSSDIIRPAYTVVNSFAEVMYRITRTVTTFGWLLAYTSSSWFFLSLYQEKTILVVPEFLYKIILASVGVIFVVLPIIFWAYTGFRKNPYRAFFGSLSNLTIALTTGNIIISSLMGESVTRQNLGSQKRISSTAIPLFTLIARGGTAFISTLITLMLIQGATGQKPSIAICLIVSCAMMLTSLTASLFVGYETIFVIFLAMKLCNIYLAGAEAAIVALLPLINGIGILIDSFISNLGTIVGSVYVGTDIDTPYSDTI
ncbi:MAG: dicarboxylate/amino acid:cation symporter [Spirochaetales bacterium]|nr:dicarboxylate/amino acid:cation symporter [Spirochaetales bacterium]